MARVTIDVERVLEIANNLFAEPAVPVVSKRGVSVLLERVLFETGNYAGYGFLNLSDTHRPCSKDCVWTEEDEWTRVYHYSRTLKKPRRKRCGV